MRRILLWIARWTGIGIFWLPPRLIRKAETVVPSVEAIPGVISGDYRRCEALGRMVKRDTMKKRDAALAIEYVIRQGAI